MFTYFFQAKKYGEINSEVGVLLYHLASKIKSQIQDKIPFLARYIVEKKLDSTPRVDAALAFVLNNVDANIDVKKFQEECGIGIVVTPEQIEAEVEKLIMANKNEILEKR